MSKKHKMNLIDSIPKLSDSINIDNIEPLTKEQKKKFIKSYTYKKYVMKYDMLRKKEKRNNLKKNIWSKGVMIFNIIIAVIGAVTALLSVLLQLNLI